MKNNKSTMQLLINIFISMLLFLLSACATTPSRLDDQSRDYDGHFVREVAVTTGYQQALSTFSELNTNLQPHEALQFATLLSKGDLLRLRFDGMSEHDGLYQINNDGSLELPFAPSLKASGHTRSSLIGLLESELIRLKWFYTDTVKVDASLVRMASVNVAVFGAVFNSGRVSINNQPIDKQEDAIQQRGGVHSNGRDLIAALAAAGGVRPDADLSQVYLKRNNQIVRFELESLINGMNFQPTPSLIEGDVIFVKTSGYEYQQLIKPSQITPPGMRVFMSNLTVPAMNNAQSAVGMDSTRMPYGSSLLDSAISANCVGGTHQANASRSMILVTRNYGSKKQLVIKRAINQLLANSSDSSVNPYVMPNDAIACYDSRFSNFRDVARGLVEIISPLFIGGTL